MTEKRLFGEELAEKIIAEFSRIEEEAEGFEFPYTVTVHGNVTGFLLEDVPGVNVHNGCEDPIFIPDSEGMTEEEVTSFAEGLAENFLGPRHVDTMYCVVINGEDEEEFEELSYASWFAESLFRKWLIEEVENNVETHEFKKDEFGKWKYKVYFDGEYSVFYDGPIIEERENVWWGEEK